LTVAHIRKQTWTTKDDEIHFRYYVIFRDPAGMEHKAGGFKLKKDAEAARKRIEAEVAAGTYGRETLTFGEFYERWIASKHNLKPGSMVSYEHTFRLHVLPFFEKKRLSQIKPLDVQKWINGIAASELSPATVARCFRYFRSCMKQAEAWELVDRAPTLKINLPRKDNGELEFLEPDDILKLLDKAKDPERSLFAVLAMSGLRLGEALALRWRDVDFEMRAIIVTRSWSYHGGFLEPKTEASRRAVPLLDVLADNLRDYYHGKGHPELEDLLFTDDGKKPLDPANVRKKFLEALEAADLKHVTMHSLRHSYASILLGHGASVKALQRALGHASATMTLNVYSHLIQEDMDPVLARANQVFLKGDGKVVRFPRKKGDSPK
jgi:integrase